MADTVLKIMQCGTCGVWHGIPQFMYDTCLEEGGFWHCPNGHRRGFKEGRQEKEAIRRERDQLRQSLAMYQDEAREANERLEAEKRRASAARAQVTRLRNRASKGVCPCCNRHFANLERHMGSKHPEFTADTKPEGDDG